MFLKFNKKHYKKNKSKNILLQGIELASLSCCDCDKLNLHISLHNRHNFSHDIPLREPLLESERSSSFEVRDFIIHYCN